MLFLKLFICGIKTFIGAQMQVINLQDSSLGYSWDLVTVLHEVKDFFFLIKLTSDYITFFFFKPC